MYRLIKEDFSAFLLWWYSMFVNLEQVSWLLIIFYVKRALQPPFQWFRSYVPSFSVITSLGFTAQFAVTTSIPVKVSFWTVAAFGFVDFRYRVFFVHLGAFLQLFIDYQFFGVFSALINIKINWWIWDFLGVYLIILITNLLIYI